MFLIIILLICQVAFASPLSEFQSQLIETAESVTPLVVNLREGKISEIQQVEGVNKLVETSSKEMSDFRKLGSGVIVSQNGYILTNDYLLEGVEDIIVVLSDKRAFQGKIIGKDPRTDLAVIKIKADILPLVKLGDSSKLKSGQFALAIGNPSGSDKTLSFGLISTKGGRDIINVNSNSFIQTDAAINQSNTGGVLANIEGEIIGINTAYFSRRAELSGTGLAMPINLAKQVLETILDKGKVSRAWLGLLVQPFEGNSKFQFLKDDRDGLLVSDVLEAGPAANAGLRSGDIIIKFKDENVKDVRGFREIINTSKIGSVVKVYVNRKGRARVFNIKIGDQPRDLNNIELGLL